MIFIIDLPWLVFCSVSAAVCLLTAVIGWAVTAMHMTINCKKRTEAASRPKTAAIGRIMTPMVHLCAFVSLSATGAPPVLYLATSLAVSSLLTVGLCDSVQTSKRIRSGSGFGYR